MSMSNADRNYELAEALDQSECHKLPIALLSVCRIERNRAKLTALGIPLTASALHSSAKTKTKPPPPKKQRPKPLQPAESSRRSTRLQGSADEHEGQVPDDDRELALCLINELCPRCGQILRSKHQQHLAACSRPKRPEGSHPRGAGRVTIEGMTELVSPAVHRTPGLNLEERLRELELSGLIEFTEEEAKFVVIGSTGNHYTVKLNDERHTCRCVDFCCRGRQRPCKHLTLVMQQLGMTSDNSKGWHQAVEDALDSMPALEGSAADVRPDDSSGGSMADAVHGVHPDVKAEGTAGSAAVAGPAAKAESSESEAERGGKASAKAEAHLKADQDGRMDVHPERRPSRRQPPRAGMAGKVKVKTEQA